MLLPKKMFLEESNPAAYILHFLAGRFPVRIFLLASSSSPAPTNASTSLLSSVEPPPPSSVTSLSEMMRQANLEMVDWLFTLSCVRFPGTVSMTTKSMGDSELRPIWKYCAQLYVFSEYGVI